MDLHDDVLVSVSGALAAQLHLADLVGGPDEIVASGSFCDRLDRVIDVAQRLQSAFCTGRDSRFCDWLERYLSHAMTLKGAFCPSVPQTT